MSRRQVRTQCNLCQPLVPGPEGCAGRQTCGGQEVCVDIPDARTRQPCHSDVTQDFVIARLFGPRQVGEKFEDEFALTEVPERYFADDKGMYEDPARLQQLGQFIVAALEMVDPDRRIDEDHARLGRRRGTGERSGSVPPSRASRRALSRSINALKASRRRGALSETPVSARAFSSKASSRATVVRMSFPLT